MILNMLILILISSIEVSYSNESNDKAGELKEYCISETLRPLCFQSEVIIIERAILGRRILGRCLENEKQEMKNLYMADQRAVGCFSDVKNVIDPMCSLKQYCEVRVVELNVNVPCYSFLRSFLEVQYSCIKLIQETRDCIVELTNGKEYISGLNLFKTTCGTKARPWTINSLAGQQINFTIFYASELTNDSKRYFFNAIRNDICNEGYVQDLINKIIIFICYGKYEGGTTNIASFISESNSNDVVLSSDKRDGVFLLSLEATGCSDLIPPKDAWIKRTENEVTIGCYSTRLRWKLKCAGHRWIGVIGNCSQGSKVILKSGIIIEKNEIFQDNQKVVIFGIVMFGAVLCLLITCVGVVTLKRYAMRKSGVLKLNPCINSTEDPMSKYNNGSLEQHPIAGGTCYSTNDQRKNQVPQEMRGFSALKDSTQYIELNPSLIK